MSFKIVWRVFSLSTGADVDGLGTILNPVDFETIDYEDKNLAEIAIITRHLKDDKHGEYIILPVYKSK